VVPRRAAFIAHLFARAGCGETRSFLSFFPQADPPLSQISDELQGLPAETTVTDIWARLSILNHCDNKWEAWKARFSFHLNLWPKRSTASF